MCEPSCASLLTAGHCGNETWQHAGVTIGTTNRNNLSGSGGTVFGDFQRAPKASSATPLNRIYVSSAAPSVNIVTYRSFANQHQGDVACASGPSSGNRCGTVVDGDRQYQISFQGDVYSMTGVEATFSSASGDSGGPVYTGSVALGIVSAVSGSNTVYGPIDLAMNSMSVRLCLDSACN